MSISIDINVGKQTLIVEINEPFLGNIYGYLYKSKKEVVNYTNDKFIFSYSDFLENKKIIIPGNYVTLVYDSEYYKKTDILKTSIFAISEIPLLFNPYITFQENIKEENIQDADSYIVIYESANENFFNPCIFNVI